MGIIWSLEILQHRDGEPGIRETIQERIDNDGEDSEDSGAQNDQGEGYDEGPMDHPALPIATGGAPAGQEVAIEVRQADMTSLETDM